MYRNRLHYQFNRNRRLISRLNLEFFALRQCAMNRGLGGWISPLSSIVIVKSQQWQCDDRQANPSQYICTSRPILRI